jgi:hypothetical protein
MLQANLLGLGLTRSIDLAMHLTRIDHHDMYTQPSFHTHIFAARKYADGVS